MHKPFIHCFKTAKEYYVYDVNTDKIIQVSFETYNFLENNIWDEKAEREIEKLINEGYLKRTRVEEVKHFATDFLESYLENRMNQLVLQVTQKCNLRCSYCVYSGDYKNRNHSQKEMSWETAKEAVDYLYGHSMSSEDIYISFYGGEPLLMFRLIKEVVEYVKREYCQRTVHFNLTTNGTLFTPEIVQYFIKNNIQIMFSLDGPKEVHDKNRIFAGSNRGSFEKLRDSMKMIYSMDRKYYKKNVSFNTVLDPQNELRTIYEFLDKDRLISKNLSRISVLNDNYTDKQCEFSGEFVEEQEYEYFKCFLSKLKRINEKFVARAVKEEFDNEIGARTFICPHKLPDDKILEYDRLRYLYVQNRQTYKKILRQEKAKHRPLSPEIIEFGERNKEDLKKLQSYACDICKHYKKHAKNIEVIKRIESKKKKLEKEIEKQKDLYWNKFLAHRSVLIDYGYLENDYPTDKGKTTSQIRSENELFLAEIIFAGVLENLTPAQLAGVICAITTEELRVEIPYIPFSEPVRKTLNQIRNIKKKLFKAQSRYDIEAPLNINPYFSSLIELWVEGAQWETVSEQVEMGEGDIVRAFKRVVDVLRQLTTIDNVPEALVFTAREAIEKILRAPVDVD